MPVRAAVWGVPPPLSAIDTDAVRVPVAVGLNVTLIMQVPLGAIEVQLLVSLKSVAFVPAMLTFETTTVPAALTLVRVIVCGVLLVPTVWAAKVKLVGESETAVPVPLRVTLCGLLLALSVRVTAALRMLIVVGLKVTLMVQLALAANDVPQLLVSKKSFGFVPVIAMLVNVTAMVEGFVTEIVCAALVVPTTCTAKVRAVGETVRLLVPAAPVPVSVAD